MENMSRRRIGAGQHLCFLWQAHWGINSKTTGDFTFFKPPFLLTISLALLHFACKMNINEPVEAPKGSWDARLNTHLKGAAFQKLLDDYVKRGLPGAVMFVKSPQGIWNGAAGYAKIETKEPMTPMHLFHSESIAKTNTATAVMMLVDEGKIDLDATITTHLPRRITDRIGNGNTARVRHLLEHTSGIRDWQNDELQFDIDALNDPYGDYTPERMLEYIYDKPAHFAPGSQYRYSNSNYLLLALIMDHVLGYSHARFVSERIIKHLGLEHTYYKNEVGYPNPPGLVNSYTDLYGNGKLMNVSDAHKHLNSLYVGEGGYLATAQDYALFIEALFNGKLVSSASLAAMMPDADYNGFGLNLHGQGIGHGGGDFGGQSYRYYFPASKTTIVFAANGGNGHIERLFLQMMEDVMNAVFE